MNVLLYTNKMQQEISSYFRLHYPDYKLFARSDYEVALNRIDQAQPNETKRIDAVITDSEMPYSYKLIEQISSRRAQHLIVCVMLIHDRADADLSKKVQGLSGVNLLLTMSTPLSVLLQIVSESVIQMRKVDNVFKDLRESNHERQQVYIPVFDINYDSLTVEAPKYKKALDFASKSDLDINRFIMQPKKTCRSTTVCGLDKRAAQHYWREYMGNTSSRASLADSHHASLDEDALMRLPVLSRTNSFVSSSTHRESEGRDASTSQLASLSLAHASENIDRLKHKQHMQSSIMHLAHTTPVNVLVHGILALDLYSLKMNLAERDLLSKGLRYQDEADYLRAAEIFTTAGLRTSKPYVSRLLLGNLSFDKGDFFNAIREYNNALKHLYNGHDDFKSRFVALFNRSITYFRMGDDQRGLKDILKAADIEKGNRNAIAVLALAQRRMGLHTDAMEGLAQLNKYRLECHKGTDDSSVASKDPPQVRSLQKRPTGSSLKASLNSPPVHDERPVVASAAGPVITMSIRPVGLSLKDSVLFQSNKSVSSFQETAQSNSSTLETFKVLHGFKTNLSSELFDRPSLLQNALLTPVGLRTATQMHSIVAQALSLFRFLKHIDKATLFELAKTVHYYPVAMQNSNLFSQFESPDSICLVLSGKIQYYMETPSHEIKTCPIAELGAGESIGVIDLLFTANDGALVNIPRIQGELEGESRAFSSDLTESLDESTTKANISTRSFHPHMFVSYNVAEPAEILTIKKTEFDRFLADEGYKELRRMLDTLNASRVFEGWTFPERVRLCRMGRINSFKAGDIILEQGERPAFLYFIVSGMCRVFKRPNGTDVLVRRLREAKFKAEQFDLKYAYHHQLRNILSRAPDEAVPAKLRAQGHITQSELAREQLRSEITKLESMLAKKAHEDLKGNSGLLEICDLYWPRLFGEASVLDSSLTGVSLGRIQAEVSCEILMIHKKQIQTFVVGDKMIENLTRRGIMYPQDEDLAREEESKMEWNRLRDDLLVDLRKQRKNKVTSYR